MVMNDQAVFLPERAFVLYAALGSTVPTDAIVDLFDPENPDARSGTSEVQTVSLTGSPTGGTFSLTYAGQTTAAIARQATAAAVQSALEALTTIDRNDVSVTGGAGGPWTITFAARLAGQNVPALTGSAASLTGGTSPAVSVVVTTEGTSLLPGWLHVGHTDLDQDIEGDEEGGKSEVRGTRQVPNLRVRDEPVTDFFTISAVQFTAETLRLYYGSGQKSPGKFVKAPSSVAQDLMVLIIYVDGDRKLGELHRKCSVKRGGPISREAENFLRMPIRFTPLNPGVSGVGDTEWLSADLFEA